MKQSVVYLLLMLFMLPVTAYAISGEDGALYVRIEDTVFYEPQEVPVFIKVCNDLGYGYAMDDVRVTLPDGSVERLGTIEYNYWSQTDDAFSIWLPQNVIDSGDLAIKCEYSMTNPRNGHTFQRVDSVSFAVTKANSPIHEWCIELWNDICEAAIGLLGTIFGIFVFILIIVAMCGGGGEGILVIFSRK